MTGSVRRPSVGDTVWFWDPDVLGASVRAPAVILGMQPANAADLLVLLPYRHPLGVHVQVERVPFAREPGGCCWTWRI